MSNKDNESCSGTCLWLLAAAAIVVLAVILWSIGTAYGQSDEDFPPITATSCCALYLPLVVSPVDVDTDPIIVPVIP